MDSREVEGLSPLHPFVSTFLVSLWEERSWRWRSRVYDHEVWLVGIQYTSGGTLT